MSEVRSLPVWWVRNIIFPLSDLLTKQAMMQRLRFLEEAQWWDRERLHAMRDELLQTAIHEAYETSFYRQLMDDAGVRSADIRTPEDLTKLPVVTKDMLREGNPRRETGRKLYAKHTSGSTGKPFRVWEDHVTAGWFRASTMLNFEWTGWQPGVPYLQSGINFPRRFDRRVKDSLLNCHYFSSYDLTDENLDQMLQAIDKHKLQYAFGYPSGMYFLAKRARALGWNQPLKAICTWGDTLFPTYQRTIESVFGAPVYNKYGCAEGMEIASQCGDVMLLNTLDVIVEYVDDDGQPVPYGEYGNILVTRLHAGAFPFVRYRLGDLGVRAEPAPAPEGRGFDVFGPIRGRITDNVVTPGGNRLIVHFFTGVLEYFTEIDSFQIVQSEPDRIVLNVVPAEGFDSTVAARMVQALQDKGADIQIDVEAVSSIPLTKGGKHRFVINHLEGMAVSMEADDRA